MRCFCALLLQDKTRSANNFLQYSSLSHNFITVNIRISTGSEIKHRSVSLFTLTSLSPGHQSSSSFTITQRHTLFCFLTLAGSTDTETYITIPNSRRTQYTLFTDSWRFVSWHWPRCVQSYKTGVTNWNTDADETHLPRPRPPSPSPQQLLQLVFVPVTRAVPINTRGGGATWPGIYLSLPPSKNRTPFYVTVSPPEDSGAGTNKGFNGSYCRYVPVAGT